MRILVFNDPHRGISDAVSKIHDKVFASIDQTTFDVVVVAGDWGAAKMDHVKGSFRAFRKAFPTKPILGVLGNHDLWDKKTKSIYVKFNLINEYAKESKIHLLENNPFEKDGVLFLGFNGWYHMNHSETNDFNFINQFVKGQHTDNFLRNRADAAVNFMIDYPKEGKKVVSVSHFPCISEAMDTPSWNGNPMHGEILMDFSDLVIFGHTHKSFEWTNFHTKCDVLNVGSGYNQLLYKIVKI